MESEGPYNYILESGDDFIVSSEGQETVVVFRSKDSDLGFEEICLTIANKAYAEGRKAAEKEFKYLLEFANRLAEGYCEDCEEEDNAPHVARNFKAWKKARGIE